MPADHFAALRKSPLVTDSGVNELENAADVFHSVPPVPRDVEQEKAPAINAVPPVPPVPPTETRGGKWRARSDELEREWRMPRDWAEGVAAIEHMPMPDGANRDRWSQIVADAAAFATRWHEHAIQLGWHLTDAFGFDPDEPASHMGVVLHIRGAATLMMPDGSLIVRGGTQDVFRPGLVAPDAPLLWAKRRADK